MDKSIIIPFINAGSEIIYEFFHEKPTPGQVKIMDKITSNQGIIILVGITGDISGRIIIDLTLEQAHEFSKAILQEEIDKNDMELIESAIGELGNMVSGRAVSKLHEMGYTLRITPPTILKGKEFEVLDQSHNMLVVPLNTKVGSILLNLSVKQT